MVAVADFVLETSNAPGTGTFNLAGTSTGRRTWTSAFASGTQVYYTATDGNQWEEGVGTVTAGSPNTLSRDAVIANSLGSTARINFTASTQVYSLGVAPAGRQALVTADNSALDLGSRRAINLSAAVASSDAMRLDQAGLIASGNYAAQSGYVVAALPTAGDVIRIDLRSVQPSASAVLYARVSVDGGQSFLQGSGEYDSFVFYSTGANGASATTYQAVQSYAQLSQLLPVFPTSGYVELDPVTRLFAGTIYSMHSVSIISGNWTTSGTPTHILIGCVGGAVQSGSVKISRRSSQ